MLQARVVGRPGTAPHVGRLNSQTTSRPPGRVTRASSRSATSGSATLRSPNEIVTASNAPSANGRCSASAATFGTGAVRARAQHARARSRPRRTTRPDRAQLHGGDGGAGGEVEHPLAGPQRRAPRRVSAPPAPVLPRGEHRVGQVVAARDAVEHRGDVVRVLVQVGPAHDAERYAPGGGRSHGVRRPRASPASRPPRPASRTARRGPAPRHAGAASSAASSVVTPAAKASGAVQRGGPGRADDLRQRRGRRHHHRRAAGQRLQRGQPERLVRAGRERDVRRGQQPGELRRGRGTKPRNVTGSPAARRSSAARRGPSPATTSRTRCPAARSAATVSTLRSGCFSGESRPQCTSRVSAPPARPPRSVGIVVARARTSRRSTPSGTCATLRAPIRSNSARANDGRADDGVVGGGHPGVRRVGHPPGRRRRQQELREQPVEPLVRDHHARHAAPGRPRARARAASAGRTPRSRPGAAAPAAAAPATGRPPGSRRCRAAAARRRDPPDPGGQPLVGAAAGRARRAPPRARAPTYPAPRWCRAVRRPPDRGP